MTRRHLVLKASDRKLGPVPEFEGHSSGFQRWEMVGENSPGAVHTGFAECELAPGGTIDLHVHSFEESFFLLEGEVVCQTKEGAVRLRPGDYGVVPVGAEHRWWNDGDVPARWAEMLAPQPRDRHAADTYFPADAWQRQDTISVDPRDPRTRSFGHINPENMDVGNQTQDRLAVSASMRTALLVYSGITVKMMVDTDLGAQLLTMFMVQYEPGGFAGPHDHPLEETYLFLEGEADAVFDGEHYRLGPGDVAFAGVGCVHEFSNAGDGKVRWLETQAPQPPNRHSYRFVRDWKYLQEAIGGG